MGKDLREWGFTEPQFTIETWTTGLLSTATFIFLKNRHIPNIYIFRSGSGHTEFVAWNGFEFKKITLGISVQDMEKAYDRGRDIKMNRQRFNIDDIDKNSLLYKKSVDFYRNLWLTRKSESLGVDAGVLSIGHDGQLYDNDSVSIKERKLKPIELDDYMSDNFV